MQVSIVIPTYNRVKDLNETLDSIIIQTTLPKEVIIVDDSDNDEIVRLIEYKKKEFKEKEILLKYIRNKKEKSLTIARKWIQDIKKRICCATKEFKNTSEKAYSIAVR